MSLPDLVPILSCGQYAAIRSGPLYFSYTVRTMTVPWQRGAFTGGN